MNSTKVLLHKISDRSLSLDERTELRCLLAIHLEELGNYDAAREAMGEIWRHVGVYPCLEGLEQQTMGNVLLRAGALTGWIGSRQRIEGAQATAKDLITQGLTVFRALQRSEKVAEAEIEMAYCYWREGAFDEARLMLREALGKLGDTDTRLRAVALLRSTLVEMSAKRFHDALCINVDAARLFETVESDALKGRFHQGFGMILRELGEVEGRQEYLDRALNEFAAASSYFGQAGLSRSQGAVENNLGSLLGTIGKFVEAHEHLDRAQALFTTLRDSVQLAQVDETRARVMLSMGRVAEAEKLARVAAVTLEKAGEQLFLAKALTTQGRTLSRLRDFEHARSILERAMDTAEQAGEPESAGEAGLILIEQLGHRLSNDDLCAVLKRVYALLEKTQDTNTLRRLSACAFRGFFLVQAFPEPPDWTAFIFKQAVCRYEAGLIKRALQEADGSVTRAAHLLGFGHHQTLVSLLNTRHKNLLNNRRPAVRRKRSLTSEQEGTRVPKKNEPRAAPTIV